MRSFTFLLAFAFVQLICGRHVEAVHLKESDDDNTETGPLTVELAGDATLLDADLVIVATYVSLKEEEDSNLCKY